MQKAYIKRNFRNRPNTTTPLGVSNLEVVDNALDEIDDRVVTFDTTKANQSDLLSAFKAVSFNSSTGVFTFTKFNDTTITVDTDIEKIAINFDYDDDPTSAHYQNLVITLDDGTVKYVDMAALITIYEFNDTSTIHFAVDNNGEISANIINGSITSDHLAPSVMAGINAAVASAEGHAEDSEAWAVGTKDGTDVPSTADQYHNNSKYYSELADDSAEDSEAYAIGKRDGTDVPSTDPAYHNNAKYWAEKAETSLINTVRSFRNRVGYVQPIKGDYSIDMITPTSGATVGQIPILVNKGTVLNPDLEFEMQNIPSSGHSIVNESGTTFTQRAGLQFIGQAGVFDDSADDNTVVQIRTKAGYATCSTSASTYEKDVNPGLNFEETAGAILSVVFTYDVIQGDSTSYYVGLALPGRAKRVVHVNGTTPELGSTILKAGQTGVFMFDGTYYNLIGLGHSIIDSAGNSMPQRSKLKFDDAHVEDDPTNGETDIELIQSVSESDWESATEDGLYDVDIEGVDIGSASDDYVEVEADGNKTYATLLNEIFNDSKFDTSKINNNSCLVVKGTNTFIAYLSYIAGNADFRFTYQRISTSQNVANTYKISSNNGSGCYQDLNGTRTDESTSKPSNGTKITLYYGNKYSVIDLQTTANRCLMSDGSTVQNAIVNKKDDSDVLTTTHTILGAFASRVGNTYIANLKIQLDSNVSAWTDILTLKNVSLGASLYISGATSTEVKMFFISTAGKVQCATSLTSGTQISLMLALVVN